MLYPLSFHLLFMVIFATEQTPHAGQWALLRVDNG